MPKDITISIGVGEEKAMATSLSQLSAQPTKASALLRAATTLLKSLLPMFIPIRASLNLKDLLKEPATESGQVLIT